MRRTTKHNKSPLPIFFAFMLLAQWNGYSARKDGGFVVYPGPPSGPGPVVFSHRSHGASGAGYRCKDCHVAGLGEPLAVTMENIRSGGACGACHDGRTNKPRSRQAASHVRECSSCHMPATDIILSLNRMDPVVFSHSKHLGVDPRRKVSRSKGFSCADCHPVPFECVTRSPVGMQVPHERGGCAQCHNGRRRSHGAPGAFAATTRCLTCHKPLAPSSPGQPGSNGG